MVGDALLGLNHCAFGDPDMAIEDEGVEENSETGTAVQIKMSRASPPSFVRACADIGCGRFTPSNWRKLRSSRKCKQCLHHRLLSGSSDVLGSKRLMKTLGKW